MDKITIDLKIYNTKQLLLNYFVLNLDEMYSANYDALIDVLSFIDYPLEIELFNINHFNEFKDLLEVLNVVIKENKNIQLNIK